MVERNRNIPILLCLGCTVLLFFILAAAVAAVIAAGIAASRTDNLLEYHKSDTCLPDNAICYVGLKNNMHGCLVLPKPINTTCETSCYEPEPIDSLYETQRCEFVNDTAQCVGTVCAGYCISGMVADCPDIEASAGITFDTTCGNAICSYAATGLNSLYTNVGLNCDPENQFFLDICLSDDILEPGQSVLSDVCLNVQPVCSAGVLSECRYTYKCADPIPLIV